MLRLRLLPHDVSELPALGLVLRPMLLLARTRAAGMEGGCKALIHHDTGRVDMARLVGQHRNQALHTSQLTSRPPRHSPRIGEAGLRSRIAGSSKASKAVENPRSVSRPQRWLLCSSCFAIAARLCCLRVLPARCATPTTRLCRAPTAAAAAVSGGGRHTATGGWRVLHVDYGCEPRQARSHPIAAVSKVQSQQSKVVFGSAVGTNCMPRSSVKRPGRRPSACPPALGLPNALEPPKLCRDCDGCDALTLGSLVTGNSRVQERRRKPSCWTQVIGCPPLD